MTDLLTIVIGVQLGVLLSAAAFAAGYYAKDMWWAMTRWLNDSRARRLPHQLPGGA